MGKKLGPVNNRIVTLDIIRGFALLGILLVNMAFFNTPKLFLAVSDQQLFDEPVNLFVTNFIAIFASVKFVTMFSFLFGLGFLMFMERAQVKGFSVTKLYTRRLGFLLMLGFIHLVFFWSGDILLSYALAGFLLLMFRKKSAQAVQKSAIGLFIFVQIIIGLLTYLSTVTTEMFDVEGINANYNQQLIESSISVYQSGNFIEILSFRLIEEVPLLLFNLIIIVPLVLSFFLFGLYIGKLGVHKNIYEHSQMISSVWKKSLIYGVSLTIVILVLKTELIVLPFYLNEAIVEVLANLTGLLICFFYMTSIVILVEKKDWRKRLIILAPVGKMALTNYLLQTSICLLIFNGYGLGLYGNFPPIAGIILTLIIFTIQIFFSHLWLRRYKFGPVEWVWRAFTYRLKPAMRFSHPYFFDTDS